MNGKSSPEEKTGVQEKASSQESFAKLERILLPLLKQDDAHSRRVWAKINQLMLRRFKTDGVSYLKRHLGWRFLRRIMTSGARNGQTLFEIEGRLRRILGERRNHERLHANSLARARRNFKTIAPYLLGDRVLDLGAGDGLLAQTIQEQTDKEVTLVDVVDYRLTSLPILLYTQDGPLALEDNAVDTTVLYGVLHHADDPVHVMREAVRVTTRRFIIKEKYIDDPEAFLVGCFFDWWGNRVSKDEDVDVNVPVNYRTTEKWKEIFGDLGLDVVKMEIPGIDELTAASPYVLFIFDKAAPSRKRRQPGPL